MPKLVAQRRRILVVGERRPAMVGAYHWVHAALRDTTGMTQAKALPGRAAAQKLQGSCPWKIACKHAGSSEGRVGMMRAAEV